MKLVSAFLILTIAAFSSANASQLSFAKDRKTDRYLVTFKSEQGFQAMNSYFMTESAGAPHLQQSLRYVRAVVLRSKDAAAIENLKNHPEVLSVEPETFTPVPRPVNGFKMSKVMVMPRPQFMVGEGVGSDASGTPVFQKGDKTPWGIVAVHAGEAWADSAAGANARVLVLDTGVDKTHPAVAGNFEKGQNFAPDMNTGEVDAADFSDFEGHGTHCSGTILGVYNEQTGFTGVAPKAKLLMGRVCVAEGCSSIAIISGINWGIQEHVDVISMSLGSSQATSSESNVMQAAERAGVVVVAASGNSATEPTYSPDKKDPKCRSGNPFQPVDCGVSFPAAYPTAIAVGAIDNTLAKTNFSQWGPELDVTAPGAAVVSSVPVGTGRDSAVSLTVSGVEKKINSGAFSGTALFATPVVNDIVAVPGVGKPEDFAQVNVAGKFALVARGEIKFADKVTNAIAAKAAGVLIYNNTPGLMQGVVSEDGTLINMPVVMIEQVDGLAIADSLKQGKPASASISLAAADYASFDGTSMATPHVAGVVALIKSANKKLTPAQVRQILTSTAHALTPNDTNQFGAGLVQADQAVKAAIAAP